ncbi:hypothetical protein DAEQUDRAFT_730639 [Daedalea quercina L-15889]|uniref:Uncharacterized protein n=1 Tax=Daedalea quercina L-15889 TaxID=1314783 RepID=A0A165MUE0_9APHY|nr:hypothetical protein DAEQUDRAFT_730639 [Daedalea quercina L-15889]
MHPKGNLQQGTDDERSKSSVTLAKRRGDRWASQFNGRQARLGVARRSHYVFWISSDHGFRIH